MAAFLLQMLPGAAHIADMEALGELQLRERGGWNRTMLYGNCLMFSLDWWFRPEVGRARGMSVAPFREQSASGNLVLLGTALEAFMLGCNLRIACAGIGHG